MTYQEKWAEFSHSANNDNYDTILNYLNLLDESQLLSFTQDILTDNVDATRHIFDGLTDRLNRLEEIAPEFLMNLPTQLIKNRFTPIFDKVFFRAMGGQIESKATKNIVLSRLKAITAKHKAGLSASAILNAVDHIENMDSSLRLELMMLLSKINDPNADYTFWMEKRKKIPGRPEDGVAIIEAFKRTRPLEALEILLDYNAPELRAYSPSEKHLVYFDTALDAAFFYYLREPDPEKANAFLLLMEQVSAPWAKDLMTEIMEKRPFQHIKNYIERFGVTRIPVPEHHETNESIDNYTKFKVDYERIKRDNLGAKRTISESLGALAPHD